MQHAVTLIYDSHFMHKYPEGGGGLTDDRYKLVPFEYIIHYGEAILGLNNRIQHLIGRVRFW